MAGCPARRAALLVAAALVAAAIAGAAVPHDVHPEQEALASRGASPNGVDRRVA